MISTEVLILLTKSSSTSSSDLNSNINTNGSTSPPLNSPSLCNLQRNIIMSESYDGSYVAAQVTVGNNDRTSSRGSSFSSFENTRESLLGEIHVSELIENVLDDELVIKNDVLKAIFLNILERLDNNEIRNDAMQIDLGNANKTVNDLNEKLVSSVTKLKKLKQDFDDLNDILFNIDCRLIQTEQYSRRESLVISGIPENVSQKELEPTVLNILHSIGAYEISSYDITA